MADNNTEPPPPPLQICKRLRSPEIDSKESTPPACVARKAGMSNRVVVPARQAGNRFLGSVKGLQIRAQDQQAGLRIWIEIFNGSGFIRYSNPSKIFSKKFRANYIREGLPTKPHRACPGSAGPNLSDLKTSTFYPV